VSDCTACADPQGDGTCAACCQENVAADMAHTAGRLREICLMRAEPRKAALLAWIEECDQAYIDAVRAVRDLRENEGWEP
jgi:hypothetical protein